MGVKVGVGLFVVLVLWSGWGCGETRTFLVGEYFRYPRQQPGACFVVRFLGGLFDNNMPEHFKAFSVAIEDVNHDRILAPHQLEADPKHVEADNEFETQKTACGLLENGVVALVGPTTGRSADHLQSLCDSKEIPHLEARWDVTHRRESILVNLHPYPEMLSRLYVDIVTTWGWKTFTVLYEHESGLARVAGLLREHDHRTIHVKVRQLDERGVGNYRPVLTEAKYAGETHFVIDCSAASIEEVLRQAQQVGLMSDMHNYILTNPDMHIIDLEPFQYGGANITGIRMLDPTDENVSKVAQAIGAVSEDGRFQLGLDSALVYDGIKVLAYALKHLHHMARGKSLNCSSQDNWEHGFSLVTYMRAVGNPDREGCR